jgi:DNA-binding transcriptional LysR family regulator
MVWRLGVQGDARNQQVDQRPDAEAALLDGLTLDQFTVFVTVVEEGSFSAAARRLSRAQSAITYTVQGLEAQTGTDLFDRSAYRPTLTPAGRALLPRARRILEGVADWRKQARSLIQGVEARLTLALDVMAPTGPLAAVLKAFSAEFPIVEVTLLVQPLEATYTALQQERADLGVVVEVPDPRLLEGLERQSCGRLAFVLVAAPDHPLAQKREPLTSEDLRDHIQLLLSTGEASGSRDYGGQAINRWRVTDMGLRYRLLLGGVGWSTMPHHLVAEDLAEGRLVALSLGEASAAEVPPELPLSLAHLRTKALGPAGRWLMERLMEESAHQTVHPSGPLSSRRG